MDDDPLAEAVRRRQQARADDEAARLKAQDEALDARDRHLEATKRQSENLRPLGKSFAQRAMGIGMKKVYVGLHEEPAGLLRSGTKWVSGKRARAWVIEKSTTYSSSTGGGSVGTNLFVLKDGQVITGYTDKQKISDLMVEFLERHGR